MTVPDPITLGHTTSGGLYDECGGCHRAGAVLAHFRDLADHVDETPYGDEELVALDLAREIVRLVRREGEQ